MHHSAGHCSGFEDSDGITEQRQIVRRRHPRGTVTDDLDLFWPKRARLVGEYIHRIARFWPMALGDETLQGADGNGHVKLATAACRLARMPADAATNGSEGVRDPSIAVRFLVPSLGDQRHVTSGLRVHWTRLHARKVRLQPLKIDEFGTRGHLDGSLRSPICYFLTVRSTVAVAPLRSTACVVGLPSSLQVFNVYFPAGTFLISKFPSLSVTAKYGAGTTTT